MVAQILYQIPCFLGEGPVWHGVRNSVFWADIEGQCIFELSWDRLEMRKWEIGHRVSLIVPGERNKVILALQGGLGRFDLEKGELHWLVDIDKNLPGNRCNDGNVDILGRLWIGTMDLDFKPGAGSLYCVENGFSVRKELEQVTISNGLVWSLNNTKAYYIDSPTQKIVSYFFDSEQGKLSDERICCRVPESMGTPDGMCMDEEGMLWVAHWGGFGVFRWNPANGKCIDRIEVPVPQVSSCTFGGKGFDHLIITTARQHLKTEDLEKYPDSGSLFVAELKVSGIPPHPCNL
jgi:sugar lactone lactonase YvrE